LTDYYSRYVRFMPQVFAIAQQSKMPGTRVGALVLGMDREPLSSGWNGAPRGCRADEDDRLSTREERLRWVVHAEANAIANAARSGHSLRFGTMLTTLMPCLNCALLIVQSGINTVICPTPTPEFLDRWGEDFKRTRQLFGECGVMLIEFDKETT
jgi:dCMP deaminase